MQLAGSTLDALLAAHPDDRQALEAKSALASCRQDWTEALRAQTKLAALRPDTADNQYQRGDLMLRAKQLRAPEEPLQRGLEIDPYAFLCHRDLGELYRASGRNAEAIRELVWVVRYFPEGDPRT
jgi:predicted Zn-dependent protease